MKPDVYSDLKLFIRILTALLKQKSVFAKCCVDRSLIKYSYENSLFLGYSSELIGLRIPNVCRQCHRNFGIRLFTDTPLYRRKTGSSDTPFEILCTRKTLKDMKSWKCWSLHSLCPLPFCCIIHWTLSLVTVAVVVEVVVVALVVVVVVVVVVMLSWLCVFPYEICISAGFITGHYAVQIAP
jgi:hypothetical protein